MLLDFLIIIFLIIGIGFIYKTYFNNENKLETKSLENIVLNKNIKIENYIPFSTIENNRSEINNPTNIKKTLFTREKTTTGFFNII